MHADNWNTVAYEYGDGIVKAEGAEKGITYITDVAGYKQDPTTVSKVEATYEKVAVNPTASVAFDFASVLSEGEAIEYVVMSTGADANATFFRSATSTNTSLNLAQNGSTYTFDTVGVTYTAAVMTTTFKTYIVSITVA